MLKQRVAEYMEHAPDILNCLSSLSSDEVFTPPKLADAMLDMLPQNLFWNPNARFIDPACKSGVFLRQIAKRLIMGLEDDFPDLRERLNHIFSEQLFGIATTKLAALISRRTLYCSRTADSEYSIAQGAFKGNPNGNIWWDPECARHEWNSDGRCAVCGAPESVYGGGGEGGSHAYEFIHSNGADRLRDMKVDVVISNPPYQMADGGAQASASPLYHLFVEQAKGLAPQYIVMIIPARWYAGGKRLDDFRKKMLKDNHVRKLVDYPMSYECFPGVDIKGGVCYFLWERDRRGPCEIKTNWKGKTMTSVRPLLEKKTGTFIRYACGASVYDKVASKKERTFDEIVSSSKPFGLRSYIHGRKKPFENCIALHENGGIGYIDRNEIAQNAEWIDKYKVYVSAAYGAGDDFPHQIINRPFLGVPGTACTETYVVIGPCASEQEAVNIISYMQTKFLRFLVLLLKNTQHATKSVYSLVPMQDFSRPWTDEELYAKYGLSEEETSFIESMIRPMA